MSTYPTTQLQRRERFIEWMERIVKSIHSANSHEMLEALERVE